MKGDVCGLLLSQLNLVASFFEDSNSSIEIQKTVHPKTPVFAKGQFEQLTLSFAFSPYLSFICSLFMTANALDTSVVDTAEPPYVFSTNTRARTALYYLSTVPHPFPTKNSVYVVSKATYNTDWSSFLAKERANIIEIFDALSAEVKEQILQKVVEAEDANSLIDVGGTASQPVVNANTNQHDRARLIHVIADPALRATFVDAHSVLTRKALNDPNRADPWGKLANAFNDYDTYHYMNETVDYNANGGKTHVVGMESTYACCNELNPSLGLTHRPLRDVAWVKATLGEFKAEWAIAYLNYRRSGQHNAEDPCAEFGKFTQGNVLVLYAFAVFKRFDVGKVNDMLGK